MAGLTRLWRHGRVTELGKALSWLSARSGLPTLIIMAGALVLSLRIARRVGRIAVEFALAVLVLVALRRLGWMGW